jgi:hypothetical protein
MMEWEKYENRKLQPISQNCATIFIEKLSTTMLIKLVSVQYSNLYSVYLQHVIS